MRGGGAYQNNLQLLQSAQTRILKIINKNTFQPIYLFNIEQLFSYESLLYYYDNLKVQFTHSESRTKRKLIIIPKHTKTISKKNSHIKSIYVFNNLPNDLKTLELSKYTSIKKLKDWIRKNE